MAAAQIFTGLPKWAQGVLAVAGLGISAIIGYTIYNSVKRRMALKKDRETQKELGSEIEDLKKQGMKPTLSKADMGLMADTLKAAFDGYGTKNADVMRVFDRINNELDVLALIQVYGIREISSGRWNPEPNFKGGLAGTLSEEMSGSEIGEINKKLEKKGIKFRF